MTAFEPSPTVQLPRHAAHADQRTARKRRVKDAPIRMFHALFALCFALAYLSGEVDDLRALHTTLGYTLAGLLAFRVVYGLVGPKPVRLTALARRLSAGRAWLATWRAGASVKHSEPGAGEGPAAATTAAAAATGRQALTLVLNGSLVALLLAALPLVLSGYAAYQDWGEVFEEVHEAFGQLMLALVLVHIGAVALLSAIKREDLALIMVTGKVAGPGPDLLPRNRAWLAIVLLVAALGFGAWRWQATPEGLWPATAWSSILGGKEHDDDDD